MIDSINNIIQSVANGINAAIGLLSWSPFNSIKEYLNNSSEFAVWLKFINWLIPIAEMVVVLEAWGVAIAIWYGLSVILRIYRVVE